MNVTTGLVGLGMLAMLAACTVGNGGNGPWRHAGLSETQQQERMLACQRQSAAIEQDYIAANSRGGVNSSSPVINNLNVRQRALAERNRSYEQCLQDAGFTRE